MQWLVLHAWVRAAGAGEAPSTGFGDASAPRFEQVTLTSLNLHVLRCKTGAESPLLEVLVCVRCGVAAELLAGAGASSGLHTWALLLL